MADGSGSGAAAREAEGGTPLPSSSFLESRKWIPPTLVVLFVMGTVIGRLASGANRLPGSIVRLELAPLFAGGTRGVLDRYADALVLNAARIAVFWDFAFIGLYAVTLTLLAVWCVPRGRRAGPWITLSWVAAALDVVENLFLLRVTGSYLHALRDGHAALAAFPTGADLAASWSACVAALCKFAVLVVVLGRLAPLVRSDIQRDPSHGLAARWNGLVELGRSVGVVLRPIWFHVAVVIGMGVALTIVPQAQDVVRRIGEVSSADGGGRLLPGLGFVCCTGAWAWTAWFWTRFLLTARFEAEPEFRSPVSIWLMTWVPRLLAFGAFAGAASGLWTGSFDGRAGGWKASLVGWGVVEVIAGLGFFWALARRRAWLAGPLRRLPGVRAAGPQRAPTQSSVRDLLALAPTRVALAVSSTAAVLLVLSYAVAPVVTARVIGSAPALLLASCAWIPLGSALVYTGRRLAIPVTRWVIVLLIVASAFNDNHRVASSNAAPVRPRRTLDDRLGTWLEELHRRHPSERVHRMYLVATEGGGIRAAYWTASVLDRLEAESARAAGGADRFSDRLFAISSVSGGSLGAAVFAAQLADGIPPAQMVEDGRAFLGQDLLSPVLGSLLFPDLLQRFVPAPVFPDRARAMERGWEARWRERTTSYPSRRMEEPFLDLFEGAGGRHLPVLLLNATRVESGTRVIITDLAPGARMSSTFPDAEDVFELAASSLRLSTAAHLSARFPYVSPAATFDGGHVVDGGYFENSGASTLEDLLAAILARGDREPDHVIEPIVLAITNGDSLAGKPLLFEEMLAPVQALLQARSARSVYAVADLRRQASGRCRQLGLRGREVPLPLGWMLSELAQRKIDEDLTAIGWSVIDGPTCAAPLACSCDALVTEFARATRSQPSGPPKAEPEQ